VLLNTRGEAAVPDLAAGAPRPAFLSIAPNPVALPATIAFDLRATGRARLRVVDATGRLVRSLLDARLAAGRHVIEWGADGSVPGRLASGVYYMTLEQDGRRTVRALTVIR
jgi:hypothetical protein